ncbi:MAG: DoxX family protein [Leptolyngbyaceae cyanobacterium SM1_1_3]|nr:DoxX family protein [Leptolyngbyaceae cyanobacterium SM1_1_3]NJN01245.1 DoxX family protein [Leptolyngbyaceae cyanobacterium RM1_1_2]NJO11951.1 DoxX family protein [Leptolyngbyaceae cyanobacterium SL_1_1]
MQPYISLTGRILLAALFLRSGINHAINFAGTQQAIASQGLPAVGLLAILTVLVLVIGSLSVLLGYKASIGAWLLIGFLIPATLVFHGSEMTQFFKNLSLIGGLLMVVAYGPGPISLERTAADKPHK